MPDPALSEAIKEAYASAPASVVTLHTLELRHPDFVAPIRVVLNHPDTATWIALGGEEVEAVLDTLDEEDRAMVGLVARLEDDAPANPGEMVAFIGMAFSLDLPPVENVSVPEITVTMDNVSREITDALEAAATSQQKIEITYRPYLSTHIEAPDMIPPLTMTLANAKADPYQVTASARMLDIGNKKFPLEVYTRKRFPGQTA